MRGYCGSSNAEDSANDGWHVHVSSHTIRSRTAANSGCFFFSSLRTYSLFWRARSVLLTSHPPFVAGRISSILWPLPAATCSARSKPSQGQRIVAPDAGSLGSGMRGSVLQADQPGLGVVALGDDRGDASADASQWTRCGLLRGVVHRSSSVSGHLIAGHLDSRRKTLPGALEELPICLLRQVLAGPQVGLAAICAIAHSDRRLIMNE